MTPDLISVVEACYDLSLDWAGLTRELARMAEVLLPIDTRPAAYTVKKTNGQIYVGNLVVDDPSIREALRQTWQTRQLDNGDLEVHARLRGS